MRLIDADALQKQICLCIGALEEVNASFDFLWGYLSALHAAMDTIENAFTIAPESLRPRGRWVNTESEYNYECHHSAHYQCSECGRRTGIRQTRTYKYCPNCGAKMEGYTND